jgi:hypothetical protein
MEMRSFIGLDVHKETISVSIAEDGRNGAVRYLGVIANVPDEVHKASEAAVQTWRDRVLL